MLRPQDRSFTFILKTPPAAVLLKKAASIKKGAAKEENVGSVTRAQVSSNLNSYDFALFNPNCAIPPERTYRSTSKLPITLLLNTDCAITPERSSLSTK